MGTSCKKIHIRKKIRKKIHKKIQEDTFNDPVSTPHGKANSSLRPDSFLKSLFIQKFLPSLRSCKNLSGTSCKKIHIRKKIRKKIHKKIQEDTFNDPVSTPYGKANSSLRPDSFLKFLFILKFLPSLRSCKNLSG